MNNEKQLTGGKYILSLFLLSLAGVVISKAGVLALTGIASIGIAIASLYFTAKRAQALGWNGAATAIAYLLISILSMVAPLLLLGNVGLILTLTFKNAKK